MSVYLDHAATTVPRPAARQAYLQAWEHAGNPSSPHWAGRRARRQLEEARERLAAALRADAYEVILTGGGTEADNLAVKGIYWARRAADPRRRRILASPVEHHAVLDAVRWLAATQHAEVGWLPVDRHGRVEPAALGDALAADPGSVALVTVMWGNNEIGTVQPVAELAAISRDHQVPFHTDAVQAVGAAEVDFAASGVDALSLSGHKVGAPVGCGALLLRRDVPCTPLLHGGGQERQIRSGTLDAPAAAALAAAVDQAVRERPRAAERAAALRAALIAGVRERVPDVVVHGDPEHHLPTIAHLGFPGCDTDALLLLLDAAGIACGTGAACASGVTEPSHVLLATGATPRQARSGLRFSFGWTSGDGDVAAVLAVIGDTVRRARDATPNG